MTKLVFYRQDSPLSSDINIKDNYHGKGSAAFTYRRYNDEYYENEIENIDNNMFRAQYGNHTKEEVKHDNPWEKMSSIYDRLFMFLHLLITIICFFVVYILYRE